MSVKYKDLEGSIPVNGDITPITRQKIEKLDSSQWPDMDVSALYDQRIILTNRIAAASSSGSYGMVQQLEHGLKYLDSILASKKTDEWYLV